MKILIKCLQLSLIYSYSEDNSLVLNSNSEVYHLKGEFVK